MRLPMLVSNKNLPFILMHMHTAIVNLLQASVLSVDLISVKWMKSATLAPLTANAESFLDTALFGYWKFCCGL